MELEELRIEERQTMRKRMEEERPETCQGHGLAEPTAG